MVVAAALLTGCGLTIPADPEGTLESVTGGQLHVGVTHNPPAVDTAGQRPQGSDVALVESFAASLDAEPVWVEGSEEALVRMLEAGDLQLVIGGFSDATPWSSRAAVTRAYGEAVHADGSSHGLVMLAPMGENAFLSALERHLDAETGQGAQ